MPNPGLERFPHSRVTVGYIPGDGIGRDVGPVTIGVLDEAVKLAYRNEKQIRWEHLPAGDEALKIDGCALPRRTVESIRELGLALKGPLNTPVGRGHRSPNVALRQSLDLYACVRPVRWFPGLPSPLVSPGGIDLVIFRESTEDVYAGLEWACDSPEAGAIRAFFQDTLGVSLTADSGLGLKPISRGATRRLVRKALEYALGRNRSRVTLVHKGNIMKHTEGAFCSWAYQLAEEEFGGLVQTPASGSSCGFRVVMDDRIADNMFQQLILNPHEYDVLVAPNLNGDYLSDAAAALVGGLGVAPGANFSDDTAVFEPTHGTAPDIAGKGLANPTSMILSGAMLLEYLGWGEAQQLVVSSLERVLSEGDLTADLGRGRDHSVTTAGFGRQLREAMLRASE